MSILNVNYFKSHCCIWKDFQKASYGWNGSDVFMDVYDSYDNIFAALHGFAYNDSLLM